MSIRSDIDKARRVAAFKGFLFDSMVNVVLTYFIAYRWLGAPGWGALIIFILWQQGDAARRRARGESIL